MADEMGLGKTVKSPAPGNLPWQLLTAAASMYCSVMDPSKAITRTWEDHHTEMCNRLPFKFGAELGE